MKFKSLLIGSLLFPSVIIFGQPEKGMPSPPGKCFAKCQNTTNRLDTAYFKYYILNENLKDRNIKLRNTKFEITEPNVNWIKAYLNRINEPIWQITNDSIETKLIEFVPEKYLKKINTESIDTVYIEIESFPLNEIQYIEVICDYNLNNVLVDEIQNKLFEKGFLKTKDDVLNLGFTAELRTALIKFQIENNLCCGQLSKETLKQLNIDLVNE